MQKIVARFGDHNRLLRIFERNRINPSWRHFVPQLGRMRTGICFDLLTTSNWRGDHRIGVLIDAAKLPTTVKSFEFEGHKVYNLTSRIPWASPESARDMVEEVKSNINFYTKEPDELFVVHPILDLGSVMHAIVMIKGDRAFDEKTELAIKDYSKNHHVPVLNFTIEKWWDYRRSLAAPLKMAA